MGCDKQMGEVVEFWLE